MRAARLLLIWAAWTVYAFFSASQNYVSRAYSTRIAWKPALQYALLDSYIWAALTPLLFWLAGRLVIRRANWWRTLPILCFAGIVFGVIHLLAFVKLLPWTGFPTSFRAEQTLYVTKLHSDVLACWAIFALRHGIEYYRQFRLRELKASQLEARLTVARLEMLRMQLQPHFLFNTLHAISALMYRDVEAADRMVTRLSDFLRLTLDSRDAQEVTLKREMEYLNKYLEIEQVRFGDRLRVRRTVEPRALDLLVPNLVLQPLVENAVRHGIAPRAAGGSIEIRAAIEGPGLTVDVCDDGPGVTGGIHEGVGISNTRARLEQLFGGRANVELSNLPGGGFRARLTLPAHTEPIHESSDRR